MKESEPNFERWSDREWSIDAWNRANFASSYIETLKGKISHADARINSLEAELTELREIVLMLAEQLSQP